MSESRISDLWKKEDWWAIYLALGIIFVSILFFFFDSSIKAIAVKPPSWEQPAELTGHFASWKYAKEYNLEAPLLALLVGLIVGNFFKLPKWLDTSLRTEYYIKTGIILLGATLPFTLIIQAGPIAFTAGVIINVILGYVLSNHVFVTHWTETIKGL